MKAPVRHWLEGKPLACTTYAGGIPDLRLTACGSTYISENGQPDRYSKNPRRVTCGKCLRAYNFGQTDLGPRPVCLKAQRLLKAL